MINITHFMRRPGPRAFSIERLFQDIRNHLPNTCKVRVYQCENYSKGIWPRVQNIFGAYRNQNQINHITGDVHYLSYLMDKQRTILTIHDLVLLTRLKGIRWCVIWFFWYWLPIKRCSVVTVISEETKKQLLQHIKCDPQKIHVIHNNVSAEFLPVIKEFNEANPRILQMGAGWNKNVERVAEALAGMHCKLVIIGALSDKQVDILKLNGIDYENHVGITRKALVAQYEECDLVTFASIYEGFGLPIIEANAVGRPVITSNISSMPEVAGEGACLVNPYDVQSIRDGIQKVINDDSYRDQLVAKGLENVKRFNPDVIASKYAELYKTVIGAVE